MTTASSSAKSKGPILDPAMCRCCRSIKKCRLLTAEYEWGGSREVYSEMFMDCFGLLLSHLDGEAKDGCVCATCVVRLRDAYAFRNQVLQCEQAFINVQMEGIVGHKDEMTTKMVIEVKAEPCDADGNGDRDSAADYDDEPDMGMENELAKPTKGVKFKKSKVIKKAGKLKQKKAKQDLLDQMKKVKTKLSKILDKPISSRKRFKPSKSEMELERDNMNYLNAVTIVHNSYVCPFTNRISIYYCYYCKDQFTNPVELRDHTLTHDQKEFESMIENRKIPKIDVTRIDCRLCDERIQDLNTFKNHLSTVHGKVIHPVKNEFLTFKLSLDNVTCTECGLTFPYFDLLKKHMIEHFGTYICDQCGACFLEQNSLRTHIKSHSKVEANYPCEICGKNLKSKYSRYLHVATVHEKKPTVNCYKCDDSFLSYALRNKHLIEVHGDQRTFPCKLCDKVYTRRKTLMEHNRRNHLKVYRHQCDLCEQRFYLPSRLKEHMATHTGERNFRCEFCDKSYPRLQSLQEHIRSHSNERRYKCDVCSATFTQSGGLKNHVRAHHQFAAGF